MKKKTCYTKWYKQVIRFHTLKMHATITIYSPGANIKYIRRDIYTMASLRVHWELAKEAWRAQYLPGGAPRMGGAWEWVPGAIMSREGPPTPRTGPAIKYMFNFDYCESCVHQRIWSVTIDHYMRSRWTTPGKSLTKLIQITIKSFLWDVHMILQGVWLYCVR